MKEVDALKVACPVCGAKAGDPCDRPLLAPSAQRNHYSRRIAARKENNGNQGT